MNTNANLYGDGKEAEEKVSKADPLLRRYWREIERYNRSASDWHQEAEQICQVYMDEAGGQSSARRFALLWANVDTLKPAVYAKTPTILCSRRYRDRDPVARTAAELMERASNTSLELYGVDEVFRMVRDDRLLAGRGTGWVRYEAAIDQIEETEMVFDEVEGVYSEQTVMREKLRWEKVCVDYVHWKDFGHNVSRIWKEVWLVWRCVYKTQDEVAERFGAEVAARLTYNQKAPSVTYDGQTNDVDGENYVKIYEVWDKTRNRVSWMVEGQQEFLESGLPPLDLTNFFPCPEPTYATKTSKSLIPKPDYCYYRDQAKEINDLTDKIHNLTQWLIVKGFIPAGPSTIADPIQDALQDKGNRELFQQVESMASWADQGGATKLIDWLPIQHVVQALQAAIQARAQLIQDVFQITGIADILRGQTDARETLGAQELKAQTGSRRVRNTKDDLARFCRDIGRLCSEIIAEKFEPQSIAEITGYKYQPPMPQMMPMMPDMTNVAMMPGAPAPMLPVPYGQAMGQDDPQADDMNLIFDDRVIDLLRNDKMRGFRIDVETDSTVQADENAEREQRTAFVGAAGQYLERAAKIVQTAPALTQVAGELLSFAIRSHHAGRTLEETIERGFSAMAKQAEQARMQPPPEDPVITVAKTQVQGEIEKNRINAQLKKEEQDQKSQLELRKQNLDAALELRQQNIDATAKARESAARMSERLSKLPVVNGVIPPQIRSAGVING